MKLLIIQKNRIVTFLNTCTVREGAATQIYGKLGELKHIKENKGMIIGVTGCFAQEQGIELVKKFPQIDISYGKPKYRKNTTSYR